MPLVKITKDNKITEHTDIIDIEIDGEKVTLTRKKKPAIIYFNVDEIELL
jgi:hypothetical protein